MCQYFVPLYCRVTFYYMYTQHLPIPLSVDGYLGSLYFLAVLHNAAVHICIQVFVWTCFPFSWLGLGVELMGHIILPASRFSLDHLTFSLILLILLLPWVSNFFCQSSSGHNFSPSNIVNIWSTLANYLKPTKWILSVWMFRGEQQ